MKHLDAGQLVDLLDGGGTAAAERHLGTCARCREQLDALKRMDALVSSVEVPEPSPLFWTHLSARVREGAAAVPSARKGPWRWVVPLAVAATLLVVAGRGWVSRGGVESEGRVPSAIAESSGVERDVSGLFAEDGSWWILAEASADLDWDEAAEAGFAVAPGAADRAVLQLTREEQQELVRILRAELGDGVMP